MVVHLQYNLFPCLVNVSDSVLLSYPVQCPVLLKVHIHIELHMWTRLKVYGT